MTDLVYERLSNSTLDELAEYFEELPELGNCPEDYDVQYGVCYVQSHVLLSLYSTTQNGVITIRVGCKLTLQSHQIKNNFDGYQNGLQTPFLWSNECLRDHP